MDDYFQKPKIETGAEKSERLRKKMQETNEEMQKIVEKIE